MDNSQQKSQEETKSNLTPWRCWLGSAISGSLTYGLYLLTMAISHSFASKPLPTGNITTYNIAVAVRTLVVGIATLATGVFGLVAIGLLALGVQILIQQLKGQDTA